MDELFVENQKSTEGVKVRRMISLGIGHGSNWKKLESDEWHVHLNRLLARHYIIHGQQQSMPKMPVKQDQEENASPSDVDAKSDVNAKESESHSSSLDITSRTIGYEAFKGANELDRNVEAAISLMEENKEEMRKSAESIVVTMMGRGGQDQFLSTHAALMADNAYQSTACLLVISGSKPLDEKVTTSKFRLPDGNVVKKPHDVATTGADLIRHYSTALILLSWREECNKFFGRGHVRRPLATFILSTRKDKTKGKGDFVARQECIVQEIIAEQKFGEHIVPSGEDPIKVLFHVDNTKSGTGNPDPTIELIKKMIVEMAREYWGEEGNIPLTWAMLDKGLGLMRMKHHKVLVIHDVYKLAARVCDISSDDEYRHALRYLCSLRSIRFYHNVTILDRHVFPNLQWVANVLVIFVTVLDYSRVPPHLAHLEAAAR